MWKAAAVVAQIAEQQDAGNISGDCGFVPLPFGKNTGVVNAEHLQKVHTG